MRVWFGLITLLVLPLAVLSACQPHQTQAQWQVPQGQWRVDAQKGHRDVACEVRNLGPGAVELTGLRRADGPDFSSCDALLKSINVTGADPAAATRRLTSFVHRWLLSGCRNDELMMLYRNPLRTFTVMGQGFVDDVARVLAALLQEAGLEAQIIDMHDHAAAMVKWDDAWHVADPYHNVVFANESGEVANLRELALRSDLIDAGLAGSARHRESAKAKKAYSLWLRYDDYSRFRNVEYECRELRPWPLPAGASVRFDLKGRGARRGRWQLNLPDPQGNFAWSGLRLESIREKDDVLRYEPGATTASILLTLDLPHPVIAVELEVYFVRRDPNLTPAEAQIFIYGPGEGYDQSTCFAGGRVQEKLSAYRHLEAPTLGPIRFQVQIWRPGIDVARMVLTAEFLHGPAAAPNVAGENVQLLGEARGENTARLEVEHTWR